MKKGNAPISFITPECRMETVVLLAGSETMANGYGTTREQKDGDLNSKKRDRNESDIQTQT